MKSYVKEIYIDNHLLVLFKPHGIATQPEFHDLAKEWLKAKTGKAGNVFLHPVHRLDKPACGLVLFARSSKALPRLNEMLRNHQMQKTYITQVEGIVTPPERTLNHFHIHEEFRAKISDHPFAGAKKASLTYKVSRTENQTSFLEITLHTGRYHQIRAQMAYIGHPIVGDQKYGSSQFFKEGAINLCHTQLEFIHPVTKQQLKIFL